jgi:hypothetical protein
MPPILMNAPSVELRQGDICRVEQFPRWTLKSTNLDLPNVDKHILAVDQMTRLSRYREEFLACVCTYDCELDYKDDRSGVLLAPVKPFPSINSTSGYRLLKDSWRPVGFESMSDEQALRALEGNDDLAFANYNFFPMRLALDGKEQDVVVDFASMTSVAEPRKAIPRLLSTKMFQLTDAARQFFQLKIALFMARPGIVD